MSSINSLSAKEWHETYGRIYQQLIDYGAPSLMASHIRQPALCRQINPDIKDEDIMPASLSEELLKGVIRGQMGFNGLIVTDATQMVGFTCSMPRHLAVPLCIERGADILLFSINQKEDVQFMLDGLEKGLLSHERLDEAVTRILALKASDLRARPLMARAINPQPIEEVKDSTVTDSLAAVPQDSLKAPVTITAPDAETQIWLNREPLAYGKWEGQLGIGFYSVSTLKEGLESKPIFLWVDDTLPKVVDLSLPKASYGVLNIHSNVVGATILINRVEVGVTPCILENLPATVACKILLKKKGYRDAAITVMPVPNDMLNVEINMKPDN
jgi:hypothetical protein